MAQIYDLDHSALPQQRCGKLYMFLKHLWKYSDTIDYTLDKMKLLNVNKKQGSVKDISTWCSPVSQCSVIQTLHRIILNVLL